MIWSTQHNAGELERLPGGIARLDPAVFLAQQPAVHIVGIDGGALRARCSLWVGSAQAEGCRLSGVIGHMAMADAEAGVELLAEACGQLRGLGCDLAIGPMDGNTWRNYRAVTQRGDEPPFFLEPDTPDFVAEALERSGFAVLANYYSALVPDLAGADPRMPAVAQRLGAAGVVIRAIRVEDFAVEARAIFELSLESFRHNYLYTPLAEAEFVASYQKIKPYVRPEFCLLAEQAGRLVGFVFCVPDMLAAQRGRPGETLIVKTLAVLPERLYAGLGGLLVERAQHAAHAAGYRRAIHALMHEANKSRNIRGHGPMIRRYTLFAKPL